MNVESPSILRTQRKFSSCVIDVCQQKLLAYFNKHSIEGVNPAKTNELPLSISLYHCHYHL